MQLSLFWSYSAFVKYYRIYGVEKWHGLFLPMQPFTRLVMVWGLVLEYIVCIHSCLISGSRHLFMIKYICLNQFHPKSLYRSRTGRHFYGTENEIWAGLGRLTILKKLGADYDQLLRVVSSSFQGQKNNLIFLKKYCSVHTKKMHILKVRKPKENLYD